MDFIERLFGLSPDNGDDSTEILWLVVVAIVIAATVYFRVQRRKATGHEAPLGLRRDRATAPRGPRKIRSAAALHSGPSPDRCWD